MIESIEIIMTGVVSYYAMPIVFALFIIGYLMRVLKR